MKRTKHKPRMDRVWAMPNRRTFTIPPIQKLLEEEIDGTKLWLDPFAGWGSPAALTNDLNPYTPTISHMDALEYLKSQPSDSVDGIIYDPPYSITQAAQNYASYGKDKLEISVGNMKYWSSLKYEIARIVKLGGKVICFGWTSMGIGIKRGFEMKRILLVPHGGSRNDTIVTVEIKERMGKPDGRTQML